MRGVKAKILRGIARGQTVGLPLKKYQAVRHKKAKRPGMMLVLVDCTRARYQQLKKPC